MISRRPVRVIVPAPSQVLARGGPRRRRVGPLQVTRKVASHLVFWKRTNSKGEFSVASPTGYGLTREDPLRGEVEEAAELEMGMAAAWASRALSLGISGGSIRFGDLSDDAC